MLATQGVEISTQSPFLIGSVTTLAVVASLFFLQFYRRTRDPLFLFFSLSFIVQACSRVLLLMMDAGQNQLAQQQDRFAPLYLLRLGSYALILFAIIQKNWSRAGVERRRESAKPEEPHAP